MGIDPTKLLDYTSVPPTGIDNESDDSNEPYGLLISLDPLVKRNELLHIWFTSRLDSIIVKYLSIDPLNFDEGEIPEQNDQIVRMRESIIDILTKDKGRKSLLLLGKSDRHGSFNHSYLSEKVYINYGMIKTMKQELDETFESMLICVLLSN